MGSRRESDWCDAASACSCSFSKSPYNKVIPPLTVRSVIASDVFHLTVADRLPTASQRSGAPCWGMRWATPSDLMTALIHKLHGSRYS